jgi:mannobiose 2-epimerase
MVPISARAKERLEKMFAEMQDHFRDELLPFWLTHGVDTKFGGYLTYLDRQGNPTGETVKTLVCQTRMIYTYSSLHRAGLGGGKALEIAQQGVEFLIDHFWDDKYTGWFWTTEQDGTPLNDNKIAYGHSFAMYALSEYGMASGDLRGMEWASKTYETMQSLASDNLNGGFYEFFQRDWQKRPKGRGGGDRKSLDVHMHLMEAFTNLYEASGAPIYKEKTLEVVDLLFRHMIHPQTGTGIAQFSPDWQPQRAIIFDNVWGSDREADGSEGRPLDNTSYGHNVEFGWLLNHTINILGLDRAAYADRLRKLYDHCLKYGIDWKRGGVYCEGQHDGPPREKNKEFWQQAEAMVAMLDALATFGDEKYLDAYENIHRFVFDLMIAHDVGEWLPLFDENNNLLRDYMAHAWKINYHTVRCVRECERRLSKLVYS